MHAILRSGRMTRNLAQTALKSNVRFASSLPKAVTEITHPDNNVSAATHETVKRFNQYTMSTYGRPDLIVSRGKGCYVYDTDDRAYLDFTAGIAVVALGHADEGVAKVLQEQAQKLVHTSNLYYNETAGQLAEMLVTTTRGNGSGCSGNWASKVFLANSGTEANEGALKFARKWGKHVKGEEKHKIVSFVHGFHGRSMGALSATPNPKYQKPFAPLVPGFSSVPYNDVDAALAAITEETCGVIVEPVQGEGGVHPAKVEFLQALRKRCDEVNALLIFDEIQCGLGRTGKLWGHERSGVAPDLLTLAKPLANGVPIGAVLTAEKVSEIVKPGDHGTTFGGNPLAAAVAVHVFGRLSKPEFLASVVEKGNALKADLQALQAEMPDVIKEVRGEGLLLGVELHKDPAPVVKMARERGLLIVTAGCNTIRVIPPLVISREEARQGVARLAGALQEFSKSA